VVLPISVLTIGIFAGSCPAFLISKFRPIEALRGHLVQGAGGTTLRRGLVLFQFAISALLIAGTRVVISQWEFMVSKDPGYDSENVVVMRYPRGEAETVRHRFLEHPNILHACVTNNTPIQASFFKLKPEGWEDEWNVHFFDLDVGVLDVFGMELLEGHDFTGNRGGRGFILNESAVKALGWTDPVGKVINWGPWPQQVMGVVKDFHFESLQSPIRPLVLGRIGNRGHLALRIGRGDVVETMSYIKTTWRDLQPDRPFNYRFLDEQVEARYRSDKKAGQMFSAAAILAIVIASLSLIGLASFTTEQRTKEIGVRKVLGATWPGLVALFTQDFMKLVVLANVLALPVSVYLTGTWLNEFAYRIEPGPWPFLIGACISLLAAAATVFLAAYRPATQDPIIALRGIE